jgi:lysophospholipase L1-like esterase
VRAAVFEATRGKPGVEIVDLALPRQRDPFAQDPDRHYAADRIHPNANGYGRWFECLLQQSRFIQRHLAPARRAAPAHPAHRLFR